MTETIATRGMPFALNSASPTLPYYAVTFVDDTRTGTLYVLDTRQERVVDERHIYRVEEQKTPDASIVRIGWSVAGRQVVLQIDEVAHAVIDFENKRSFCRTGLPPPLVGWSAESVAWTVQANRIVERVLAS